jgi:nifR3 family TIM-barrel protein
MSGFAQQISSDENVRGAKAPLHGGFSVGNLALDGAAFLAPMAGVTDVAMRRLARKYGAGLAFSEMVASAEFAGTANGGKSGKANKVARESLIRAMGDGVFPHAVQIAGFEPDAMAEAARLAEESGADLIDINMGCPSKRVCGGAAGSALMRDLDHATRLIGAVTRAVRVPVSVKMRLGWDESSLNAPELARRAEGEGACMVAVHGRTRSQFYTGVADWAAIRPVAEALKIPVVANGDCRSPQDARTMLEQSGARAAMIGRAALGQPWLVGDIAHYLREGRERPPLPGPVKRAAALEHFVSLLDIFGPEQGLRHARKHLAAYADVAAREGGGLDPDARQRLVRSDNACEVFGILSGLYRALRESEAA